MMPSPPTLSIGCEGITPDPNYGNKSNDGNGGKNSDNGNDGKMSNNRNGGKMSNNENGRKQSNNSRNTTDVNSRQKPPTGRMVDPAIVTRQLLKIPNIIDIWATVI